MAEEGGEKFQLNELFQGKYFNRDVEDHANCSMNNRLESQVKNLTYDVWYQYASQLFRAYPPEISRLKNTSHECSVKIFADCAESLAAKDVDGTSDPYCAASVKDDSSYKSLKHFKHRSMVTTKVIPSTVNPVWQESFEVQVDRGLVKDGFVHIQVWDTDDAALCSNKKKIRGLSGLGRLVKEKAQSAVSNKDDHDDFMGYAVLPLNTIPAEGCEKWLKLQPSSAFQQVSGRIKVKLEVNAIQKQAKSSRFPIDLLFAGLLKAIVDDTRKNAEKKDGSCWNGDLPELGKMVLREMSQQNSIPDLIREIARWEVYVDCHLHSEEVDFLLLDGIIEQIKKHEDDLRNKDDAQKLYHYSLRTIRSSVRDFMKNCCDKIADHRVEYSRDKNNYVITLGGLLFCVKKLALLSSFQDVDFHEQVVLAVADGTDHYYSNLYASYLEGEVTHEDDLDEKEDNEFEDYGLKVLLKFAKKILNDLIISKTVYHDVFQKILSVDYFTAVYRVIHDNLSNDLGEILSQANKKLVSISDPGNKESEHLSTLLFNMYAKVRDIAVLRKHAKWEDEASTQQTEQESGSAQKIDMTCFQNWFRPALLRWLQMSRIKTTLLLKKAVEVDQMKSVDEIVKHTSSAVDTMGCLNGVLTFWNNLSWPDPVDAYTIALRLTDEVATMIETYADMVHGKLRQVGFFDDEGQFDVTEELCLAVNNLQFVKSYIDNLKVKMKYDDLATAMEKVEGAPPRDRVMNTFNSLVRGALVGINKKLENVSSVIGNKLKPDMQKYLKSIAKDVVERLKNMDIQSREMTKAKNTKVLDDAASEAIQPLMNYLTENVIRFREWLNQEIFLKMLNNLWTVLMKSVRKVILDEFNSQPPGFYYQWKLILKDHLICFFHADGSGLSMTALKSGEDYKTVESQLRIQSAGTEELLSLFFCKMLTEQTATDNRGDFGHLNVYAHYDRMEGQLKVDVISAENLLPLDVNGLSDPFVVISLVPKPMFPNVESKKTQTVKKTIDPLFDCSYSFDVDYKHVTKEATFIHFAVFDADVIGRDELEGEAVLPLSLLDGVGESSSSKKNRTFKLPLTQPKHEDQSKPISNPNLLNVAGGSEEHRLMIEGMAMAPLALLMKRTSFDEEANQFCKERSKVKTLTPPSATSKKSSLARIFS